MAAMGEEPFDMHANRCMAYRDLKDCAGMVRTATEMIRLRPDSSDAFRLRGAGHLFGGDPAASIPDYQEAIRLDPSDANAHYLLAWAYRDTGLDLCQVQLDEAPQTGSRLLGTIVAASSDAIMVK
jgi:tetratricopeptide (TPR) repeat protein